VVCAVAILLAVVDSAPALSRTAIANAVMGPELAALKQAQETVKNAQLDLDGIDQNTADQDTLGPKELAKEKKPAAHPDLGEALMQEDDASSVAELGEDSDAAVQVEATQADVEEENNQEGLELADPKDINKVFDLAKTMKQSDLLPDGWHEKFDQASGKNYYENAVSKTTSWDPPRSLVNIALAAAQGQAQLKRELSAMKEKMETKMESSQDLGESGGVSAKEKDKCPKMVSRLLGEAKQLRSTVKSLSAKLNLSGEQQEMLKKLMKTEALPEIPEEMMMVAKPKIAKKATKAQKAKQAKKVVEKHNDLGESAGSEYAQPDLPAELGESAALEDEDDRIESAKVESAMKAESQKVAHDFAQDESRREAVVRKAAVSAGKEIDDKMAAEDRALFDSDKDTDSSMKDIIGDQAQLETEQALFRGTMTPDQVNQVVDPEIAQMEKEDLTIDTSDDDFQPVESAKDETMASKK